MVASAIANIVSAQCTKLIMAIMGGQGQYLVGPLVNLEPQNVRNFPYPVRIRWIKLSNLATFIYTTGYLNVRKMSERLLFRTFIGALGELI